MEHMRRIAYETVLRACGFGSLAIFCVMIGMSFMPRLAFQAGGFLTTLMALILIFKAYEARTKDYRRHRDVALSREASARRRLRAMGERDRAARDLSDVRALDLGDRHRDVGDRADVLAVRDRGPHAAK